MKGMKMKPKNLLGGLLAIGFFVGGYGLISLTGQAATNRTSPASLIVDGTLETDQVDVSSKLPGRLSKVLVEEGDLVKAGQVIAELEAEELDAKQDQATAGMRGVSAQVAQGKLAVELEQRKSEDQVQQAEAGVAAAKAAYGMAAAKLDGLKNGARPQEILQLEQGVNAAQAAYVTASKTYNRIKGLAQDGVVAQQKADEVEMLYRSASAQLAAAKAKLNMGKEGARKEEIQAAEHQLEQAKAGIKAAENGLKLAQDARLMVSIRQKDVEAAGQKLAAGEGMVREVAAYQKQTRIISPISGRISQRMSRSGEIVAPGYAIMSVARTDGYWVRLFVEESKFAGHRAGEDVVVEIPALGKSLPGRLTRVLPAADFATQRATNEQGSYDARSLEMRVALKDNPQDLVNGMTARVHVKGSGL